MNQRKIWLAWRRGLNTVEIARHIEPPVPEHQVDQVISRCLDAVYCDLPMPWNRSAA